MARAAILRTRVMTDSVASGEAAECLCTDLRGWAAVLRRPDKVATVVTNYPALPEGTQQVEVLFDGLDPMTVAVTPAADATAEYRGPGPGEPPVLAATARRPTAGMEGRRVADARARPRPCSSAYTATVDRLVR